MKERYLLKLRAFLRVMKKKVVKYNKKGVKRVENTIQKPTMPKKDLNDRNTEIIIEGRYIRIIKK